MAVSGTVIAKQPGRAGSLGKVMCSLTENYLKKLTLCNILIVALCVKKKGKKVKKKCPCVWQQCTIMGILLVCLRAQVVSSSTGKLLTCACSH